MTRILALAILSLILPTVAAAQRPHWTDKLELGEPIYVTTHAGDRIDGIAGQVTAEGIVMKTPLGVRTVPYRDMQRVQKRDPQWTGAVIGAATGIVAGIVGALVSDCQGRQCEAEERGLVMAGAIYGSLTGWMVDFNSRGKSTIFTAEPPRKVTLRPRRGGITAAIGFSW